MKILILGGTSDARQLANRLVGRGHEVMTSLAGRTRDPMLPEGGLRIGGFGGVPGLTAYLHDAAIEHMIDATHPYAGQISRNAVAAAEAAGVPLLRVMRPAWQPTEGQDWVDVATVAEAARSLAPQAKVLLTTGHGGLADFIERRDCLFVVRLIEPPELALPPHAQMLLARPPYSLEEEIALMAGHRITHLVSKNSGGGQTIAKLEAAHRLGIQVIMIARPHYQPALEVDSVAAALAALGQ